MQFWKAKQQKRTITNESPILPDSIACRCTNNCVTRKIFREFWTAILPHLQKGNAFPTAYM